MISPVLFVPVGVWTPSTGLPLLQKEFQLTRAVSVLCNPILKRCWRSVDRYLSRTVWVECTPAPEPGTKDRILIQFPSVFQWGQQYWTFLAKIFSPKITDYWAWMEDFFRILNN